MKKVILFVVTITLVIEILITNFVFDLVKEPFDLMLIGMILVFLFAFLNYLLIKIYLQKKS